LAQTIGTQVAGRVEDALPFMVKRFYPEEWAEDLGIPAPHFPPTVPYHILRVVVNRPEYGNALAI